MPVPKRKVSKSKLRTRKAAKRWKKPNLFVDPKTGNRHYGHCMDPETKTYRGRTVKTTPGPATPSGSESGNGFVLRCSSV